MPATKKTAAKPAEVDVPDAAEELAAAEAEAKDAPIEVEHGGHTYTLPAPLDYPVDVVFSSTDFEAVRLVLGEEQWEVYRQSKPTIRDFQLFNEKINRATGN